MFLFGFTSWPEAKDGRGSFGSNKSPIGHLFPDGDHYRLGARRTFTHTATSNLTCERKGHHVYVPLHDESAQFKRAGNDGIPLGCVKIQEQMDKLCNLTVTSRLSLRHFLHCITLASSLSLDVHVLTHLEVPQK